MGFLGGEPDPACTVLPRLNGSDRPMLCFHYAQIPSPLVRFLDELIYSSSSSEQTPPRLSVVVDCFENTCPTSTIGHDCEWDQCVGPFGIGKFDDGDREKSPRIELNFTMGASQIVNVTLPLYSIAIRVSWLVGNMMEETFAPTPATTVIALLPTAAPTVVSATTATTVFETQPTTVNESLTAATNGVATTASDKNVKPDDGANGALVIAVVIVAITVVVLVVVVAVVVIVVRKRQMATSSTSSTTSNEAGSSAKSTNQSALFQSFRDNGGGYSAPPKTLNASEMPSMIDGGGSGNVCLICNKAYPTLIDLAHHNSKR